MLPIKTPPMGWNSWNTFGRDINEQLIFEMADAMVEKGYRDAGYEYLVIDDCWSAKERDENGLLVAHPEKFPHGMKAVADYVHEKGLKFGIYSCAGTQTCDSHPGSFDHEYSDAAQFASWGVDFLKYDFCFFPQSGNCINAYHTMSMALKASGRDILFSPCNWGVNEPWTWMRSIGATMYRSTGDIQDNYVSMRDILISQLGNFNLSAPYCYNDMDMLVVGMNGKGNVALGGMTETEYRTHFAAWCFFGVPLMMGADLRSVDDTSRLLMQNRELLAINQDAECRPPFFVFKEENNQRIAAIRHLSDGSFALGCFNLSDMDRYFSIFLKDIGIPLHSGCKVELTNIFTGETTYHTENAHQPVFAHDCAILRGRIIK